jgi:hypothetical protein
MVGPTVALAAIATIAVICIVLMAGTAILTDYEDPHLPVLTPVHEDEYPGRHVWTATVQYQSTGNTERLVIVDDEQRSARAAREDIEAYVQDVEVIEISNRRLYHFDPVADR